MWCYACERSVKVISSRDFDGFLLTGLYTVTSPSPLQTHDTRIMAADSSGFVCSIVHSHIGHRPRHQLQFVWKAPSTAIGCINFLLVMLICWLLIYTTVLQSLSFCAELITKPSRRVAAAIVSSHLLLYLVLHGIDLVLPIWDARV